MSDGATVLALPELGAVAIRGADAVRFLQGQLSQNVERVSPQLSLLAGYHNAQGRVIAVLRLVSLGDGELLAVLPRELAPTVVARLSKFVLRSKVTIADESGRWQLHGIVEDAPAQWPRSRDAQVVAGEGRIVCVAESLPRWLRVTPRGTREPQLSASASDAWRRHEIADGEP
ncbi:MAG TPA: hypothetical protein VJ011_04255, partial [Steroidobacteraceae bacterium]|nr:hypothetical protein [Steroidobacteraceae bacterium]